MIKTILMLLFLLPCFAFAQSFYDGDFFASTDTIGTITAPDTVEVRISEGSWKILAECVQDTAYVTADDKTGEVKKVFALADESWWTYTTKLEIRIYSTGTDTITTSILYLPSTLNGALSLVVCPDTSGTNTTYENSYLHGN